MTELEQYLNAKGISVNIDEEDIEFEVRFRRIVEKSCAIFQNQAIQLSGAYNKYYGKYFFSNLEVHKMNWQKQHVVTIHATLRL